MLLRSSRLVPCGALCHLSKYTRSSYMACGWSVFLCMHISVGKYRSGERIMSEGMGKKTIMLDSIDLAPSSGIGLEKKRTLWALFDKTDLFLCHHLVPPSLTPSLHLPFLPHRTVVRMFAVRKTLLRTSGTFCAFSSSSCTLEEATLNRAERLKSRFWKSVSLQPPTSSSDGFQILLDNRSIRTPSGQPIVIPKERELLATCIAQEWSEQKQVLKPHTLPLTSLAARALEGCRDAGERKGIQGGLIRYLENETVWYVVAIKRCFCVAEMIGVTDFALLLFASMCSQLPRIPTEVPRRTANTTLDTTAFLHQLDLQHLHHTLHGSSGRRTSSGNARDFLFTSC